MILLLGGTSETAEVVTRLAEHGYKVLVSSATDAEQTVGDHPHISRRVGRLSLDEMVSVIQDSGIQAIVDVTHPYAAAVHKISQEAADLAGIRRFAYVRPSTGPAANVLTATDHEEAAQLAFAENRPVLLTTGSKNLEPYARESRRTGLPLVARVLDHPDSIQACREAGMDDDHTILGRGPFSVEENRNTIIQFSIGTLVTKDSGVAGGVEAKIEAARLEGCRVVLIQRPHPTGNTYETIDELLTSIVRALPPDSH